MKKQDKMQFARNTFLFQAVCILSLVLLVLLFSSCTKEKNTVYPISEDDQIMDTDLAPTSGLLYSSNMNGSNALYRLDDNGDETVLLSDPNYDYWWPKVAPDKSKFLVYRSPANPEKDHDNYQNADLLIADIDGKNVKVLIEKGKHGWLGQGVSRWNKDGTKILMIAEQNLEVGKQWRMVITDADGNNPKNLSDMWILDPNFSIDNSQIVFTAFPDNKLSTNYTTLELHRADYNSADDTISNITRLTTNLTRDHDPAYSPDGTKIVFSAGNQGYTNVDIVTYDVATQTEIKRLDDAAANGGSMCWSLDSSEIYFHSLNVTAHPFQIKKLNTVSEEVTTILAASPDDYGYFHPEIY